MGRNIAFALKALGFDVSFLTAIADDENGRYIKDGLTHAGIEVCGKPFPSAEERTGVYCCILDDNGDLVCAVNDMGITKRITADLVQDFRKAIESSDYLVIDANLSPETIRELATFDIHIVADCVSAPKAIRFSDVLESIYLLKSNFTEACALAGVEELDCDADGLQTVMEALVGKGLRRAIISLGKDGAFCYEVSGTGTKGFDAKAMESVNFVSTNGCGDVLLAGFLRALSEGLPLEDALWYGQAASGLNSESLEAVNPKLNYENVKRMVEEHYEQISRSDG